MQTEHEKHNIDKEQLLASQLVEDLRQLMKIDHVFCSS